MRLVSTGGWYVNKVVMPLVKKFSRWPQTVGGSGVAVVTYQGRRSGKTVSLVVGFSRTSAGVAILVELPDHKRWWRNFQQEEQPITVEVGGKRHRGHASADRTDNGKVLVDVTFD